MGFCNRCVILDECCTKAIHILWVNLNNCNCTYSLFTNLACSLQKFQSRLLQKG